MHRNMQAACVVGRSVRGLSAWSLPLGHSSSQRKDTPTSPERIHKDPVFFLGGGRAGLRMGREPEACRSVHFDVGSVWRSGTPRSLVLGKRLCPFLRLLLPGLRESTLHLFLIII